MSDGPVSRLRGRLLPAVPAFCLAALLAGCGTPGTGGGGGGAGSVDPETLMGLSPNEVAAMMGQPELRREETPAQVWQYRTGTCVFDVYFYDQGGRQQVTYYEARHRQQGTVSAPSCLGQIVAGRGGRATS